MQLTAHKAKRILEDVHPEEKFVLKDGKEISNLKELGDELETMEEHVFEHHMNEDRNDFSSWIHHSVKDPELARTVKHINTQRGIKTAIKGRTFQLKKHIKAGWLKQKFAKWEILDFALGIIVGVGASIIIIFF